MVDPASADSSPGHEPDRVSVSGVVRVAAALAALVIAAMIGMVIFFQTLDVVSESSLPTYASPPRDKPPPPPRLDPSQSKQLRALRAEHQRILTSYEWVDEEAGVARIPIERAMDLLADQLPVGGSGAAEQTPEKNDAPKDTLNDGTPKDGTPKDATSKDGTPKDATPKDGTSEGSGDAAADEGDEGVRNESG